MPNVTLKTKILLRNDTELNWMRSNPILMKGEVGYCTDKEYLKFGDGVNTWGNILPFYKSNVVLKDCPPSDDDAQNYQLGTIWMNVLADTSEIFILTYFGGNSMSWLQLVGRENMSEYGLMREGDFAKSSGAGANTGYVDKALTADKLKTSRTITLTGGVSGSKDFDGSGNITIPTTLSISEGDIPTLPLTKIRNAGSAAALNAGKAAGQVPILGSDGKLDTAILPQLAIVDVVEAASNAEMITKAAQKGDICLRSDTPAGAFILAGDDPKVLSNWKRIPVPADAVLSVNGRVGVISLTTAEIPEAASRRYYSDERVAAFLQSPEYTFIMDGGNA